MRHFILLFLFSLGALAFFYNEWSKQPIKAVEKKTETVQPDYIAEDIKVRIFDDAGQPNAELESSYMAYYANTDSANFTQSIYRVFNQEDTNWQLTANQSQLVEQEFIYLTGGVELVALTPSPWFSHFSLDTLDINLIDKSIYSDSNVKAYGDNINLSAIGLSGNLAQEQLLLEQSVNATIKAE
ncbi:LPS export ABC transporter periplasmic protein LptC [Catenovulum sp. SM1970]|uniref:LPS export ABC transporter periplasmic protein LptC n=1 Tax=Marinifaba aquimaris TaxID=2741323 RepID=UPI001574A551|nr:LPS export ABC transporter periplasmic protein LptC [Marinifaba aquimaris]NTS75893.1 LPS export ABC transporter periplasmic protein LptC [Marinifaba aquimaris]